MSITLKLRFLGYKLKNEINSYQIDQVYETFNRIDKVILRKFVNEQKIYILKRFYEDFIDKWYRPEVLKLIRRDLFYRHSGLTIIDLASISSHIYDYCALKLHNVTETHIADFIMYKNYYYLKIFNAFNIDTNIDEVDKHENLDRTLIFLKDKYMENGIIIQRKRIV